MLDYLFVVALMLGSTNPPLTRGKLRLYSMRFCPFAQRALLVLDAKQIPYDVVNINLQEKPEWYFLKNPLGKVPALETEAGDCIYESLIVADYLDEKYPQTPLHSTDSMQKAKDRILVERFASVSGYMYKFSQNMNEELFSNILTELEPFEKELMSRGKNFFGGDKPGMMDYMIWPWGERLSVLKSVAGEKFVAPKERFPKLHGWKKAMKENAAVQASFLAPEIHAKYFNSRKTGKADYDLLLK